MAADLHLDPDTVARLAATVRRVADGLPTPPVAPTPGLRARPGDDVASELLAFAVAAEWAARRVRDADETVARGFDDLRRDIG